MLVWDRARKTSDKERQMAHVKLVLLLALCGVLAAVAHATIASTTTRSLLQTPGAMVPVFAPNGAPMAASPFADNGGNLPNVAPDLAKLAKAYKLTTTTPNDKSAVNTAVGAMFKLDGANAATVAAAIETAAKALIAAAQANELADVGNAITNVAASEVFTYVQPLGKAINKLVVAQPAKSGGIFGLVALYSARASSSLSQVGYELMFTWQYAGTDQATLNALALASADAANAGGPVAARTWGQALGNNLGSDKPRLPAKQEDAYAKAVASVLCKGSPSVDGWASVYSVALAYNSQTTSPGCGVLSKAWGLVKAQKCAVGNSKGLQGLRGFCKIK